MQADKDANRIFHKVAIETDTGIRWMHIECSETEYHDYECEHDGSGRDARTELGTRNYRKSEKPRLAHALQT